MSPALYSIEQIESGFVFEQRNLAKLRPQDFESLLDQAADHLERGLRDRQLWMDLSERAFLSNEETFAREKEKAAIDEKSKTLESSSKRARELVERLDPNTAKSGVSDSKTRVGELAIGAIHTPTETIRTWRQIRAWASLEREYALQLELLSAEANNATIFVAETDLGVRNTTVTHELNQKEKLFGDGKALDWKPRLEGVQNRYLYDLDEAWACMTVAAQGLKDVFDYNEPLPMKTAPLRVEFFDSCLIWVRQAIAWLVAEQRSDQTLRIILSLRHVFEDQHKSHNFDAALSDGRVDLILNQSVLDLDAYLTRLRLRGIAFSMIERNQADDVDIWRLSVYRDEDNRPCIATNVTARNPITAPDVVGATLLHNLSPFASWRFRPEKFSLRGRQASAVLEDIWMELICVGQVR